MGQRNAQRRKISTGLAGSATGVPTRASSQALEHFSSLGDKFQVVGTTKLEVAILALSSVTSQWEKGHRAALRGCRRPLAFLGDSPIKDNLLVINDVVFILLYPGLCLGCDRSACNPLAAVRPKVREKGPLDQAEGHQESCPQEA